MKFIHSVQLFLDLQLYYELEPFPMFVGGR